MATSTPTAIWPVLTFRDALAAIDFLEMAFGLERTAVYARDDDPTVVEHAEMRWPYVVCTDPDELFARAVEAGAPVVRDLSDEDYGSRGFTVRDSEGNLWSFGTYSGETERV